jgi:hypothetical protein
MGYQFEHREPMTVMAGVLAVAVICVTTAGGM